jgi:hypothetical protein
MGHNLLTLPPELRNRIWHQCFSTCNSTPLTIDKELVEPGLLSTCRQVRQEARGMYYHLNTFKIQCDDTGITGIRYSRVENRFKTILLQWRHIIGPTACQAISHVVFEIQGYFHVPKYRLHGFSMDIFNDLCEATFDAALDGPLRFVDPGVIRYNIVYGVEWIHYIRTEDSPPPRDEDRSAATQEWTVAVHRTGKAAFDHDYSHQLCLLMALLFVAEKGYADAQVHGKKPECLAFFAGAILLRFLIGLATLWLVIPRQAFKLLKVIWLQSRYGAAEISPSIERRAPENYLPWRHGREKRNWVPKPLGKALCVIGGIVVGLAIMIIAGIISLSVAAAECIPERAFDGWVELL